ncbi:MAG: hypothetical protein F6K24_55090 [Okeania sp. SIO2D1]|nr:hypothetical protein [Okeania sp. SIO2D1]
MTQLFKFLREQRCLIIFDDVQELFIRGEFAGKYQSKYQDYKDFFQKLVEIEHQSSLILISQEQCQEMLCLDEDLYPIKCLELSGIENIDLKKYGLQNEEAWSKLINLYEGNPVYLKDVASLIKNVFLGKVSEFLNEDSLIITEDMKSRLSELFHRLSPPEQKLILRLSKSNESMSRDNLRQDLEVSSIDLINGLQSLSKRYLLKRIEGDKILFDLSPIVREYVINCRID